jgi:hypothetical protein
VPLVERAIRPDGKAQICIIKPGWGSSGYYSESLLKRDGPRVFKAGTHMYANHPTETEARERPERDIRDLWAIQATDAQYLDNGPSGPGLYAEADILPGVQPHLEALAPHIGTSIRALGKARAGEAAGRKGPVVESLVAAQSVDFVTQAGRGGEIVQLFEAARGRRIDPGTSPAEGSGRVDNEQQTPPTSPELKNLREAMANTERERDDLATKLARAEEALLMHEVRGIVTEELGKFDLSPVTAERLAESLPRRAPIEQGKLDADVYRLQIREAVKAEVEYLAKATGVGLGTIRGLGTSAAVDQERQVAQGRVEEAMVSLFGEELGKTAAAGRH